MTTEKQLIRVGHSPDPDDAFMFYALAKDKIDTGSYQFTHELVDIETLNRAGIRSRTGTDGCQYSRLCSPFGHLCSLCLWRQHG